MSSRKQTTQGWCVLRFNDSWIHWNMRIPLDDSAVKLGCCDWCGLPLNASTQRIGTGYHSKLLLIIHSKGGWRNFWGLLHCDDRRSPLWATRDRPQHGRSHSDTVMLSMTFNRYDSKAIFFIILVLFCFVFNRKLSILCECWRVWFLLPSVSLQSNWAWKT